MRIISSSKFVHPTPNISVTSWSNYRTHNSQMDGGVEEDFPFTWPRPVRFHFWGYVLIGSDVTTGDVTVTGGLAEVT